MATETQQLMAEQLSIAIKLIGQTLPIGHEVFFYRDGEDQRVRMQHVLPGGSNTEYVFTKHLAESAGETDWKAGMALREEQLATALRDLLAQIELHTDCMDGRIKRESLDDYITRAEALVGCWPDFSLNAQEVH